MVKYREPPSLGLPDEKYIPKNNHVVAAYAYSTGKAVTAYLFYSVNHPDRLILRFSYAWPDVNRIEPDKDFHVDGPLEALCILEEYKKSGRYDVSATEENTHPQV